MANLVPIPWQPHLFLTPHTLGYLERASNAFGQNLYLYDAEYTYISPAWRSYAQQHAAWIKAQNHTGPPASNPDTGNRYHMRGAAFDLRLTTAAAQRACRSVGLIRDSAESWHWNDPNWASMPIIPTNSSATGGTSVLFPERTDVATLYQDHNSTVFALGGDSPGTSANWLVTTSSGLVKSWAKAHGNANVLTHDSFVAFAARYSEPVKVKAVP